MTARLNVNIDHVATVRQARRAPEPSVAAAALMCEDAGADGITVHLRADRRHIQDDDLFTLRRVVSTYLNLEIAATDEMIQVAIDARPDAVSLVPETPDEITTEGGLDTVANFGAVRAAVDRLRESGLFVSIFIDPDPRQIEAAHRAGARTQPSPAAVTEELYRACRSQSSTKLGELAQKVTPLYTWDDIVLSKDTLRHLREICLHVRHRRRVFTDWNFDKRISMGKGTSALFSGPSGTGKTMAAEIIANDLGLDLYKIDLSTVVSKYIGETEKNLSRIFQEAESSNAILFFDEADAIFGKRSEVKDAHDRYANIEINYLLQKMEEYEGIVIMATNFQKNIDEAFTRRLRFIVEIPLPDRNYRARIWRNIFPAETPCAEDIAFDFLAGKFEISGGNIKNIALNAAFLAAENSGVVSMKHIIRATRREFQKMGRMFVKSDFGEYYHLLEND